LVALAHDLHLITPLDQTYQGFVMHQILRDYLRRDFALNDPAGLEQAHDLASRHFEGVGDVDAAIFHARRAGDDARLTELVWANCGQRLASAQSLVVQRWLDGLEPARIEASCPLALAQAWASSHQGDLGVTQHLLYLAEEHCRRPDVPQDVRDAVELLRVTLGTVAIPDIVDSMRLVTERLGTNEWATLSNYMLGIGSALSGDLRSARLGFTAGANLSATLALPVMEAHCLAGLVDTALAQGEPRSVTVAMARLRELIDTVALDRVVTAAPVLTTSAQMFLIEGRVSEARVEADRALRLAATMRQVAPWAAVLIRIRLAGLYMAVGAPAMAAQLLDEAKELHGPATACPVLDHGLQQLSDAMASIGVPAADARGVLTTAEIRVLQYLPTHLTFAGIGEKLFVSRNTIKSQVHSIYGKLHVNSRSEAVEVARGMGLLR
jgi:LuxR family maltose regulon positive regulatory protein